VATINPPFPGSGWTPAVRPLRQEDSSHALSSTRDALSIDFSPNPSLTDKPNPPTMAPTDPLADRTPTSEGAHGFTNLPSTQGSPNLTLAHGSSNLALAHGSSNLTPTQGSPNLTPAQAGAGTGLGDPTFTSSPTGGLAILDPTGAPFEAAAKATLDDPQNLGAWLNARARPVFSAQELDGVVGEIRPLMDLVSGKPDPSRWNAATWNAFQLASHEPPEVLTRLASTLDSNQGGSLPMGLQLSVCDPQVDRDTLVRMLRLRAFASQIVEGELPTLLPSERSDYLRLIHDRGYADQQLARCQDPTSLLCPAGAGGELLEAERRALLPALPATRFDEATRVQASNSDNPELAFPKLSLGDFFASSQGPDDQKAREKALAFLSASGKDVEASSPELGGKSMREYLNQQPSENRQQWLSRLYGKQVLNSLARPWDGLIEDISKLQGKGADGEALRQALAQKQSPALAPILLMLNAPSLFEPAIKGQSGEVSSTLDSLMQVFWRASNPQLTFQDPLIGQGQAQLQTTHQEQLQKDRELWTGVISMKKTAVLAGVTDDKFEQRVNHLPQKAVADTDDPLKLALMRLERDLGAHNPTYQNALAAISEAPVDQDSITRLHALRFDPTSFAVELAPGQDSFTFAGQSMRFKPQENRLPAEFVSATTVAYRVEVGEGEARRTALLRLPKGAMAAVDHHNQLQLSVFDPERFADVSARLKDFELMDARVDLTQRSLLKTEGGLAVLEFRGLQPDAGQSLKQGAVLQKEQAGELLDQWLAGLSESDPVNRPYGVLYELGPDNYVLGSKGLEASYVDVALPFRNERERAAFGFVTGGYGSAANWVVADNNPLTQERTQEVWRGQNLSTEEQARRGVFLQAMQERLDPAHPVWASLPADKCPAAFASYQADVQALGALREG